MNRYDQLVEQLDRIIGFLEVSDSSVFEAIRDHDRFGIGMTIGALYNDDYSEYQIHICNSALLLGFSYFESYVYDMLELVLQAKPELNKHKFTLKYVIDNKTDLFDKATEDYLRTIGFTEALSCIENELHFFENDERSEFRIVYDVRNCIMHNAGIADTRLRPKYTPGDRIITNSSEINSYGLMARKVSRAIWDQYRNWRRSVV